MDIYIAVEEKDRHKFIFKAEVIKKELEKNNLNVKYAENIEDMQLTNRSLCLVFTNNLEYIEKVFGNRNLDLICITGRVESAFILDILNYVKDIYFVNIRVDEIVMRISGFVKNYQDRKKCIRGKTDDI